MDGTDMDKVIPTHVIQEIKSRIRTEIYNTCIYFSKFDQNNKLIENKLFLIHFVFTNIRDIEKKSVSVLLSQCRVNKAFVRHWLMITILIMTECCVSISTVKIKISENTAKWKLFCGGIKTMMI